MNARLYDPVIGRFFSPDPIIQDYEFTQSYNRYSYCQNNPVNRVDLNGMITSPIYDVGGDFLGTDDQGLKGKPIIMKKANFIQGMSHQVAKKMDLAPEGGNEYRRAIPDLQNYSKFYNHYKGLSQRPDYDGYVSISEGIAWAKAHSNLDDDNIESNGVGNATPNDILYLNALLMDFGTVTTNDLILNTEVGVNLLYKTDFNSPVSIETTYALGRTKLKLLNEQTGAVQVVNGTHNIYNWDTNGNLLRKSLIQLERIRTGVRDKNGFPLYIYGIGKVDVLTKTK